MKRKSFLVSLFLLAMAATDAIAGTCYQYQFDPTPSCVSYGPTAPSGWTWTGGDNTAYPGEVVVCTEYNFTGTCFYAHPSPSLVSNTLGEIDSGTWHVKSWRSNLSGWLKLFDGQRLTGPYLPTAPGPAANNHFVNFQVSSVDARN